MKSRNKHIILIVAMALTCICGYAKKTKPVPDGVFFKIEGKGMKQPSYILGSVHTIHGDFYHEVKGLENVIKNIDCLATELKMDYLLHPEQVKTTPNISFSAEDEAKVNAALPAAIQEFTDQSDNNPYNRFLTPVQFDSLNMIMRYFKFDENVKAAMELVKSRLGEAGQSLLLEVSENAYRTVSPFSILQGARGLLEQAQQENFIKKGYTNPYQGLDHTIMLTVNDLNVNWKLTHLRATKPKVDCIGLDSTYTLTQYQESNTGLIRKLVDDCTASNLANIVYTSMRKMYRTSIAAESADTAFREGKGKQIVNEMTEIEPEAYTNEWLVDGRNKYWMTQIPDILNSHQQTLIVVGLAHLMPTPNSKGLIAMLQEQGFKITKVQ